MKNKIKIAGTLAAIAFIIISNVLLAMKDGSYISTAFFFTVGMLLGLIILKFSK